MERIIELIRAGIITEDDIISYFESKGLEVIDEKRLEYLENYERTR